MSSSLPKRASVVVIGGGVHGLATAFNLALHKVKDVLVLDAGYWQGGASGRNGSLIRGGFGSPEWTAFFGFSNRCWMDLSRTLGHNVMFSRRGYTMIAHTGKTAAMFERAITVHRDNGVSSCLPGQDGLRRILPAIDRSTIVGALHLEEGGIAPHHAAMKAYLAACQERNVAVRYRTRVTGIESSNGRVSAVLVGDSRIETDTVLIAAGGYSVEVAALAGVALDGYGMRIEAMALEPIRPLIGPALAIIDKLCYMHQTPRGEIVGGVEVAERPRISLNTDLPVLTATARAYIELFPQLAQLRVLRHWAGLLHITQDFAPLMGEHPALRGLWISAGWSYGWAGSAGAGVLMAKAIATGDIDTRIKPFAVDRFDRSRPVHDAAIVLAPFS
ncbi:FAD-dependent oxidoreductase [soil metagenome]